MSSEVYTRSDIEKMEKEIEHRRLVVRKEAIEAVKEARAQGDLSENFEYYAAKREKNRNESRIKYLERLVRNATVIDDTSADDEVGLDTEVEVFIPMMNETQTFHLVTSIRGNSLKKYISVESPVGKALLGHRVGETVTVHVNSEVEYDMEIRKLTKGFDDSEDEIRRY